MWYTKHTLRLKWTLGVMMAWNLNWILSLNGLLDFKGLFEWKICPIYYGFLRHKQALTSTRGYSLPDFLYYYPYPTRKFLLPDRVEGSQEHSLNSIFDISKESKCNTFVMMDIFTISRNENFALQQCQSRFIFKFIIKLIYKKTKPGFCHF